ncbi:hypothetical protein [Micromonospora sp. NBC_01739]|uniref:hypothetical protein n=1 Tax=Micromonospora sp. NBC_01739 TaxID=2975985 RepID=UPI002E158DC9|nr:hypothetical protein OIE53_05260 [Micromonospora sp. NBC_01739]
MRGIRMFLRRLEGSAAPTDYEHLLKAVREPRPAAPSDPLTTLLHAATAPPRPWELTGEEAALAAFRAARHDQTAAAKPRTRRRRFTAGAVVWIAGVVATATAGAALAAVRLDRPADRPPPAPYTAAVAPSPSTAQARPDRGGTDPTPRAPESSTPTPDATPGASVAPSEAGPTPTAGLPAPADSLAPTAEPTAPAGPGNSDNLAGRPGRCKAYLSKSERQREKALRTPAFSELVIVAGGADNVLAYCQALLAETDPQWLARRGLDVGSTTFP